MSARQLPRALVPALPDRLSEPRDHLPAGVRVTPVRGAGVAATWSSARTPPRRGAPGGPLAAVCGLCGGAGTSTLALLIARWAARERQTHGGTSPVLLVDVGSVTTGLSLYANLESPRSLGEIADSLRYGSRTPGPMFATADDGLRLIVTPPRPQPAPDRHALTRVLSDAQTAHSLTVADCGTLAALPSQQLVLEAASHVIWTLPASDEGAERAELALQSTPRCTATEIVVARHEPSAKKARTRTLSGLAESRQASLVLMPYISGIREASNDSAFDLCGPTLQALSRQLRR